MRSALILFLIFSGLLQAAAPPPSEPAWQGRALVIDGDVAPAVALSVNSFGRPIAVWADTQGAAQIPPQPTVIRLRMGDGFGWKNLTVGVLARPSTARVDVATSGATFVAYHDSGLSSTATDDRIRVARMIGSATSVFSEPVLELAASEHFDLLAPANTLSNQAYLVFRDAVNGNLRLQTRNSAGWTVSGVPSLGTDIRGISLLDDNIPGRLNLAYSSVLKGQRGLRFVRFDGVSWSATTNLLTNGVSSGEIRLARHGNDRLAVLAAIDDLANQRVELFLSTQSGSWGSQPLESFGAGPLPAQVNALGPQDLGRWAALYRVPQHVPAAERHRYALQNTNNLGAASGPAMIRVFGQTPGAVPIAEADQGALAAVLSTGYSAALLQRVAHADLDFFQFLPNWDTQPVVLANVLDPAAGIALSRDQRGRPQLLAASETAVIFSAWGDQQGFNSETVISGVGRTAALAVEIGFNGTAHVVLQRLDQRDLLYAYREIGAPSWTVQTIDSVGDVGADAQVHVTRDGLVFISYADLTLARAVIAVGRPGQAFQRLLDPQTNPPPLRSGRLRSSLWQRSLSDGTPVARVVAAFVGDTAPGPFRVQTLEVEAIGVEPPRESARSFLVPALTEGAQQFSMLEPTLDVAMLTTAEFAIALVQRSADQRRLRMARVNSLNPDANLVIEETFQPRALSEPLRELRLAVRNGDLPGARILTRRMNAGVDQLDYYAFEGATHDLQFGTINAASGRIAFDARAEDLALWFDQDEIHPLVLARRNSTRVGLGVDPVPSQGGPLESAGPIYVVDCDCVEKRIASCFGQPICLFLSFYRGGCPLRNSSQNSAPSSAPAKFASTSDLGGRLRVHFNGTAAGRYYLALWDDHGEEIMALTRAQPQLYWQRASTFASFAPALTGLVDGRGSEYRFTPELISQARAIWQGWADAGSPELRATINRELARLNQLNVFQDMNFSQWFNSLTVGASGNRMFADGFETAQQR